jgi:hypothetical protein
VTGSNGVTIPCGNLGELQFAAVVRGLHAHTGTMLDVAHIDSHEQQIRLLHACFTLLVGVPSTARDQGRMPLSWCACYAVGRHPSAAPGAGADWRHLKAGGAQYHVGDRPDEGVFSDTLIRKVPVQERRWSLCPTSIRQSRRLPQRSWNVS